MSRTCLDCRFLSADGGEDEWYPEEHSCWSMHCLHKKWWLETDDFAGRAESHVLSEIRGRLRMAAECELFKSEADAPPACPRCDRVPMHRSIGNGWLCGECNVFFSEESK